MSQVNSDKIYWQRNLDGTFSQVYIEKKKVGHCISTKAVGSDERMDITHLYKYPEGKWNMGFFIGFTVLRCGQGLCPNSMASSPSDTEEERIAVETASRYGSRPEVYAMASAEDVSIEVTMDGEGPRMGNDAQLTIILHNNSAHPRRTTLHSHVAVMYYTGVLKGTVKKEKLPVELMPNEGKEKHTSISVVLYCNICMCLYIFIYAGL